MVKRDLDKGPTSPTGTEETPGLAVANLVLAILALFISVCSVVLSVWVNAQENDRQREDLAAQVIFVRVIGEPDSLVEPGYKPVFPDPVYTVANFGRFPLEDVVVEADPGPGEKEEVAEMIGMTARDFPQEVPAVRVGTVGPCESASVSGGDYTYAVFTDVNGRRWSKAASSPPRDEIPESGLERRYRAIDLLDPKAGVRRTRLDSCQ